VTLCPLAARWVPAASARLEERAVRLSAGRGKRMRELAGTGAAPARATRRGGPLRAPGSRPGRDVALAPCFITGPRRLRTGNDP